MTKDNFSQFARWMRMPMGEESLESADHDKIELYKEFEEYTSQRQDRVQRKQFADRIFTFVKWYMISISIMLLLNGYKYVAFSLSDSVLITLLSTTTANVIALFAFVAKYLFRTKK